jgi:hypothetical protein
MKLSLISLTTALLTLSIGCGQTIIYSHTKDYDVFTVDSRGDNLADYSLLHQKAEDMCQKEGHKDGIEVLDSRPGANPESHMSTYSFAWKCKEPSLSDKATELAKKVEEMATSARNSLKE